MLNCSGVMPTNIAENIWFIVHGEQPGDEREKRDFTTSPTGYKGTMKTTTQGQAMTRNVAGTNTGKACQSPY